MPLSLEEIEEIQADLMADDIEIDFEKMKLWDKEKLTYYFENGGVEPPAEWQQPPCVPLEPVDDATFKKWFPKWKKPESKPKFRLVCFHNAGSAESNYTGRGLRMPTDNPFVVACNEKGGELLAVELPGRESRRAEQRFLTLRDAAAALFPILAPTLNQPGVPYVMIGHSMGTWMLFETLKLLMSKGVALPAQVVVSSFPSPAIPVADRPWRPNKGMSDSAFKDECRTWSVNEVVFSDGMWMKGPNYESLMRDDFTLFDAYEYEPAPAKIPVLISAYYARDDKNVKRHHVNTWQDLTSHGFKIEEVPGNHLFFYQYDVRNKWMERVLETMPDGFC